MQQDIELVADHFQRQGVPFFARASRRASRSASCEHMRAGPPPAQAAFLILSLYGDKVEDQRFKLVDRWFLNAFTQWANAHAADGGFEALAGHGNRVELMLRAFLDALATAYAGRARPQRDVEQFNECLNLARHRFAPNELPARLHGLRDAVAATLADTRFQRPLPRPDMPGNPLDAKLYFKELNGKYPDARNWVGKQFRKSLSVWLEGARPRAVAGDLADYAEAVLRCLGGERDDWRWWKEDFFRRAHAWVVTAVASDRDGGLVTVLRRHLTAITHLQLVIRALGWLCGATRDPRHSPPPPADLDGNQVALANAWLRHACASLANAVIQRNANARERGDHALLWIWCCNRYQASGPGVMVASASEQAAVRDFANKHQSKGLRAMLFMHQLHEAIGYAAPEVRNSRSRLYYPIIGFLKRSLPAAPACSYGNGDRSELAGTLTETWLGGGQTIKADHVRDLPTCLNPLRAGRSPRVADMATVLEAWAVLTTNDVAWIHAWAMRMVDELCDPWFFSAQPPTFGVEHYKNLMGALKDPRHAEFRFDPELDEVRLTHARLFGELACGQLQARVRTTLGRLANQPAAGSCPLCGVTVEVE